MENIICLLSCLDQKGIVAEVTSFILKHDGNILHLDQHIDQQSKTLFMRVEWEAKEANLANIKKEFTPISQKFEMQVEFFSNSNKERIAIFVSKMSHCLYDILLKNKAGELACIIPLIISNHKDCQEISEHFQIPFYYFEINTQNTIDVERQELNLLTQYKIDCIILARYMKILSKEFVKQYENRIINVHHSFLPAFIGKAPYEQAYARGVKLIGATSHYVTPDLDSGPIIEQATSRISHSDNVKELQRKGKELERFVLSKALRLHLTKKILVYQNKTVIFD